MKENEETESTGKEIGRDWGIPSFAVPQCTVTVSAWLKLVDFIPSINLKIWM